MDDVAERRVRARLAAAPSASGASGIDVTLGANALLDAGDDRLGFAGAAMRHQPARAFRAATAA